MSTQKYNLCIFFEKTAGVDGKEIREFIAICLPEENGNEITYKKCNSYRRLWADRKKEPAGKKCLGVENYAGRAGKKGCSRVKIRNGIMPASGKNP